ncbi:hypothetical protein GCM10007173_19070 [Glutamicibacter ardleyensis]|uniref:Integrase n=1 Tax=Glutamicibacter ardleyensis TaxID=225894 RepID=A0ABQ2DK88_9MICC|nr:hypothetical protein GCM10007173_19070 [Glutamicibacter ardleyensis]
MHTLRHTAALNLLAVGMGVADNALWLGYQRTQSTDAYSHPDMSLKEAVIDRKRPLNVELGTYRPPPDILV